jgi:hypothetical protein
MVTTVCDDLLHVKKVAADTKLETSAKHDENKTMEADRTKSEKPHSVPQNCISTRR